MEKMNKKGVLPVIIVAMLWVLGIGAASLIIFPSLAGLFTGFKLNSIFNSIPTIGWIFIGILLVILLLRKKRR